MCISTYLVFVSVDENFSLTPDVGDGPEVDGVVDKEPGLHERLHGVDGQTLHYHGVLLLLAEGHVEMPVVDALVLAEELVQVLDLLAEDVGEVALLLPVLLGLLDQVEAVDGRAVLF